VSSTCDLKDERNGVEKLLGRTERYQYVGAEYFGSRPNPPKEECLSQVVNSNVYVGIFGNRYGTIPEGENRSMTELEYCEAKAIRLPRLIYFKKKTAKSIDSDEDHATSEKLKKLKAKLKKDHHISYFVNPARLPGKVVVDLDKLETHEAINNTNRSYRSRLKNNDINGEVIPRKETDVIISKLLSPDARHDVLLTGAGGIGKSGIILQVLHMLDEKKCPFLAFRADELSAPQEFGGKLGLYEEDPVRLVQRLAEAAQGHRCVLAIDQLGSLGLARIRESGKPFHIDSIIEQAQAHPNMRLLIACNESDLENDEFLVDLFRRYPLADRLVVGTLPQEIVKELLEKWVPNVNLSSTQLQLLSVPLHLKLFMAGLGAPLDTSRLTTATYLFDSLWKNKNQALRNYGCSDGALVGVTDTMIDYMIRRQILLVPAEELDLYTHCANAMTSENILVSDGTCYSFFHESFFSYAFARRYFGDGDKLVSYLKRWEQHVFQRSLIRSLLEYGREKRFDDYLTTVETLLNDPDIEFHLKQAVLATLASLENPREEEWKPLARIVDDDLNDPRSEAIWRTVLYRSVNWFNMLDSNGVIGQWLDSSDEKLLDKVIMLLSKMQPLQSRRVAELLNPYVGKSETWGRRLKYIVSCAPLGIERTFFDLFLKIIDDGAFDEDIENAKGDFWNLLYSLHKSRIDWTCEAIGHFLSRSLTLSVMAGQLNPFDYGTGLLRNAQGTGGILLRSLPECAEKSPTKFVFEVIPFMLSVIYGTTDPESEAPLRDLVWRLRYCSGGYSVKDVMLSAMETAFRRIAADAPEQFADFADALGQYNYDTINYLIIRGYAANEQAFANKSVDYLCDNPARMEAGYGDGPHWATRELLVAVTPYCSEDKLARLEHTLLTYYSTYERTIKGHHFSGLAQFILLDGVTASRRSTAVTKRLQELTKRFGQDALEPPRGVVGGWAKPPIPEEEAALMTDDEWLAAIKSHDYENCSFVKDEVIGGARELSFVLQSQVKKDPTRFANLACAFPETTQHIYFEAVLRGIAQSEIVPQPETVFRICHYCHSFADRRFGLWIPDALASVKSAVLSKEELDILIWYATKDPNPTTEEDEISPLSEGAHVGDGLYLAGRNSVRGSSATAIAQVLFYDKDRPPDSKCLPRLMSAIEATCLDPSAAVRSCGAQILFYMLQYDQEIAINYLFRLLDIEEDALLITPPIRMILRDALGTRRNEIEPILQRMVRSKLPEVATAGAEHACDVATHTSRGYDLANECLSGDVNQRRGVANVCARRLPTARFKSFCQQALIQLFDYDDEEIRSTASSCFMYFKGDELSHSIKLIEEFLNSSAFTNNYHGLIVALERTTSELPSITPQVCKKFLDVLGDAAEAPKHIFEGQMVVRLVKRGYMENRTSKALQQQYHALINPMLEIGLYGAEEMATELSDLKLYAEKP
jgi:hypothetical protein